MKASAILPHRHVFAMECGGEFFIFPPYKCDRFSPVRNKVERCFRLKRRRVRKKWSLCSGEPRHYYDTIKIEGEVFKLVYLNPDYSLRWGFTA